MEREQSDISDTNQNNNNNSNGNTLNAQQNNNFNNYLNNNLERYQMFINDMELENDFTKKKKKKSQKKKKKIKVETISFKKGESIYEFQKYKDKDIGLDSDLIKELIEDSEDESNIKKISEKEEDYSSDDEQINMSKFQCFKDLKEAFKSLKQNDCKNLFYMNYHRKLFDDKDIKKIKKKILNVPKDESSFELDEEFEEEFEDFLEKDFDD